MKSVIIVILLISIQITCYAQHATVKNTEPRTISGCITDAETGEPVIGASVFIANTTLGALTDLEGNYRFTIPGEGSYQLVVSHVGYQPVFKDIEPGNTSVENDIALINTVLDEIIIEKKVQFRKKDIDLFWKTVLGESPSRKTIYPVNPEDVYYFYNRDTKILKVTCRVPLRIINNETGYSVLLILDNFTHDYKTEISSWRYEYVFSELKPLNNKQQAVWEENREKVYRISLQNFIKSLYHNTLMENGFLLTSLEITDESNNAKNNSGTRYTISSAGNSSHILHDFFTNAESLITTDSFWDTKMLSMPTDGRNVMLICFGKPIQKVDIEDVFKKQGQFIYTNPNAAKEFLVNLIHSSFAQNIIQTPRGAVEIFPDGTYSGDLMLLTYGFSPTLQGLNLRLPLNYMPAYDDSSK